VDTGGNHRHQSHTSTSVINRRRRVVVLVIARFWLLLADWTRLFVRRAKNVDDGPSPSLSTHFLCCTLFWTFVCTPVLDWVDCLFSILGIKPALPLSSCANGRCDREIKK
jgi:hypothetical protein